MMLQRRNPFTPFGELGQMQESMERMRRRFGTPNHDEGQVLEAWAAPLDVVADGDDYVVRASLPGVAPDNIQVAIEDNVLTIRGETAAHYENTDGSYLVRERRSGSFHRSLRLPDTVDQTKVEPCYEHGVLTITLPKAEAKKAKQFEVMVVDGPVHGPVAISGS